MRLLFCIFSLQRFSLHHLPVIYLHVNLETSAQKYRSQRSEPVGFKVICIRIEARLSSARMGVARLTIVLVRNSYFFYQVGKNTQRCCRAKRCNENRTNCFFLYFYVILIPNCIVHHEYFMPFLRQLKNQKF